MKLQIFGKEYRIKSDASHIYMEKVAEYVDSKFKQLSNLSESPFDIAVLVALNIADELFQECSLNKENREVAERTVDILEKELLKS